MSLPSTVSTVASESFMKRVETLSSDSAAFQKSSSTLPALGMPCTTKPPSSLRSGTPSTMTPPDVLAKADTVSHTLRGSSPCPSRPSALFASRRLPSLYVLSSLRSNTYASVRAFFWLLILLSLRLMEHGPDANISKMAACGRIHAPRHRPLLIEESGGSKYLRGLNSS